jgi:hypothetical protein
MTIPEEHIIEVTCSKCGSQLLGPEGKAEPEADDIVRCPIHGDIGRFEDMMRQAHEMIGRDFSNIFEEELRKPGLKVTKK